MPSTLAGQPALGQHAVALARAYRGQLPYESGVLVSLPHPERDPVSVGAMTADTRVFLALGSNINPERHLMQGLRGLADMPGTVLVAESSWYRTLPWGIAGQADFVNLVVEILTGLSPRALLRAVQGIELRLGRVRAAKNGPRTLDVDILLYGNRIVEEPGLWIPHQGLLERDFMLIPLVEIAPDLAYPGRSVPLKDLVGDVRYRQILEIVKKRGGSDPVIPHPQERPRR